MLREVYLLLFVCFVACEVDVHLIISKETNLTFDTVKFIDNLVSGNYTMPNSTNNGSTPINLIKPQIKRKEVVLLNASDLLCVNGSCIEQILELPPLKTTAVPTTALPTITSSLPKTTSLLPATTSSLPITTSSLTTITSSLTTTTSSLTTTTAAQPTTAPPTTAPPTTAPSTTALPATPAPPANTPSGPTAMLFVGVGVGLTLVFVVVYFFLAGGKPRKTTLKASPPTSLPEQHVLRIAIDWPPRPPPHLAALLHEERKTRCTHMKANEGLHHA